MLYVIHRYGEVLLNSKNQPMVYTNERNAKIAISNLVQKPHEVYKKYKGEQWYIDAMVEYNGKLASFEIVPYVPK